MKNLILKCSLSPGDVVMLTAAVRDLHRCYPKQFTTDVRTPCGHLWENNPFLTPLDEKDSEVEVIECHYPLIHRSNQAPYHFIHGYVEFLNERLGLQIRPTEFRGDIYISEQEKSWFSQIEEITGESMPFWIIVAGGKCDYTVKWWETRRWQEVVDHFRGKILFVQVGESGHHHPPLEGVLDLRGKTDLRQLVRLVYHAQGVICPVTLAMHLAAAVEVKGGFPKNRPCVVVAGGREPSHWEAYSHHQFLHTNGALACCDNGGCWKARTRPLGDGDEKDRPEHLCVDVVDDLPRCMDMITADEVIHRVGMYFAGGAIRYLTESQWQRVEPTLAKRNTAHESNATLTSHNARAVADRFITTIPPYPGNYRGRGIVICGGGLRYFTNAWVCIKMLRHWGCQLPVQVWHLGNEEMDERMKEIVSPLGVECVDAIEMQKRFPVRLLKGWELKPYSILHAPFREVLFLDADNMPVVNPEFLFETDQFKNTGAIFWPDFGRLGVHREIWNICGVAYRDEPEFESGQIVLDKKRCWRALQLAMHYNEHSDFYYHHVHGDKETFHMAFRKLELPYAMPVHPIHPLDRTMCQHDFEGRRIFQHRNMDKWELFATNRRIPGFLHEEQCLRYVEELRTLLGVGCYHEDQQSPHIRALAARILNARFLYRRVGHDERPIQFLANGRIGEGEGSYEQYWNFRQSNCDVFLELYGARARICALRLEEDGVWRGRWEKQGHMPVELVPMLLSP